MNVFNKVVGLTLILGLFLACGNKPKKDLGYDYDAAAMSFFADESFYPILDEELDIFSFPSLYRSSYSFFNRGT